MSMLEQAPRAGHASKRRLGLILTALATVVVLAVVVFLTLPGPSRTSTPTNSTAAQSTAIHSTVAQAPADAFAPLTGHPWTDAPPAPPVVQYPWTDAPPPAAVRSAPARHSTPVLRAHVRGYGAVQ